MDIDNLYKDAEAKFSGFDGPFLSAYNKKKGRPISLRIANNEDSERTVTLFGYSRNIKTTNFGNGFSITDWAASNSGIGAYLTVECFASNSTGIFVGGNAGSATTNGVYLSTDSGTTWTLKNTGITGNTKVACLLATSGSTLFAGKATNGIFKSTDNGDTWAAANTGLTNTDVNFLLYNGTDIFAATYGGIFRSKDNGATWDAVNTGLTNTDVLGMAMLGNNLFAATLGGVFTSNIDGDSWSAVNTGLTDLNIGTLFVDGSNLWAGTYFSSDSIFLSTDNGANWTRKATGITNGWVEAFAKYGDELYAATVGAGIYKSTDTGDTWTAVNTGLTDQDVYDLLISGTTFLAATEGGGVNKNTFVNLTNITSDGVFDYAEVLSATALNPFTTKSISIKATDGLDDTLPDTVEFTDYGDGEIKTDTIFIQDFLTEFAPKTGTVNILIKKKLMPIPVFHSPYQPAKSILLPFTRMKKPLHQLLTKN